MLYRAGYSLSTPMRPARPINRRVAVAVSVIVVCGGASAAYASELPDQVSSNWAGYAAVTGASTSSFAKRFTSATGTWVQPTATCVPGEPTFSAFWVGIGGYKQSSKALEQIGSEADCSSSGQVSYYAWWEYVPNGPGTIHMAISPGDTITATVSVKGDRATVTLIDETTGATFSRTKRMRHPKPDVSAADWIAEAPSNCNGNSCTPLTLTNFGTVGFTNASATAVGLDGYHSGVINDPDWIYGAINLQSRSGPLPLRSEHGLLREHERTGDDGQRVHRHIYRRRGHAHRTDRPIGGQRGHVAPLAPRVA
jgi:hypothetical protein